MLLPEPGFYRSVRSVPTATAVFAEQTGPPLPERWLQQVWRHQRLQRRRLRTADGRRLRILHPGFWNRGHGPDFSGALVAFDDLPARRGDIEVDLVPSGWFQHGHHRNPDFRKVLLRVVWSAEDARNEPPEAPPLLALRERLDAPIADLGPWLDAEAPGLSPSWLQGRCSGPLNRLPPEIARALVAQAADVRLDRKAEEFAARAAGLGWERALWEGVFGALGYRHNTWPMRHLAEALEIDGSSRGRNRLDWEVLLLGTAGELEPRPGLRESPRLRELWHQWWRLRDGLREERLPPEAWHRVGIRPANSPQRRLALAARWLAEGDLAARLDAWIREDLPDRRAAAELRRRLMCGDDGFWSRHGTLTSAESPRPMRLLGPSRFTDLAVNVFFPWLLARGRHRSDGPAPEDIHRRYHRWPRGQDNAVLRQVRLRLAGPAEGTLPRTAAVQQGLLQIARDFCGRSDALCHGCRFPALVRRWSPGTDLPACDPGPSPR